MVETARKSHPESRRLALEAGCDVRTAARALAGQAVRPLARRRIEQAAKKLGIKLPERKE